MKTNGILLTLATALLLLSFISPSLKKNHKDLPMGTIMEQDSVLRHVVLFKFKADTPKEKLTEMEDVFNSLPSKIAEIASYEWGLNNSPEGLEKGFTHCYLVTFKNEQDRAIYLPHVDHQAFVALIKPYVEDVLVVDYWTK